MHKAKACVISCMDFRFQDKIQNWIKIKGLLGECDQIILAGASRDLVKPLEPYHKTSLLRQIELSIKLHNPDDIIIIDHQDCGGYAQDGTIISGLDLEEDEKQHKIFAKQTYDILSAKYPDKNIEIYYTTFEGKFLKII